VWKTRASALTWAQGRGSSSRRHTLLVTSLASASSSSSPSVPCCCWRSISSIAAWTLIALPRTPQPSLTIVVFSLTREKKPPPKKRFDLRNVVAFWM
jgi:hypothetical protein